MRIEDEAAAIEYRNVTVLSPGGTTILDRISFNIGRGERIAFLGRSGAGKTTALKVINGLIVPASGQMLIGGETLAADRVVAMRRKIGYVMQQPALFPHRNVFDNIATVPRLLGWDVDRTRIEAERLLAQLDLPSATFSARFPRTLSGGQQQRVAIARALIASPEILLCDEPFSALDPLIRAEMQTLLRDATREREATTLVFVTHDVREALRIAQRVVLLDAGRVVVDASAEAFASHEHPLVRRFLDA